jgi:signal peptidase I
MRFAKLTTSYKLEGWLMRMRMEQTKRLIPIIALLLSVLMPSVSHATLNAIILHQTFLFDLHDLLLVRTFKIPVSSMAPTLEKGDYLIATRFATPTTSYEP